MHLLGGGGILKADVGQQLALQDLARILDALLLHHAHRTAALADEVQRHLLLPFNRSVSAACRQRRPSLGRLRHRQLDGSGTSGLWCAQERLFTTPTELPCLPLTSSATSCRKVAESFQASKVSCSKAK